MIMEARGRSSSAVSEPGNMPTSAVYVRTYGISFVPTMCYGGFLEVHERKRECCSSPEPQNYSQGWPCTTFANLVSVTGVAEQYTPDFICNVCREIVCAGICFLSGRLPKRVCCVEDLTTCRNKLTWQDWAKFVNGQP